MKLTKKALKAIGEDQNLVAALIHGCGTSYPTVRRWININHEKLTTATALNIICSGLKLKREEILIEDKKAA